MARDFDGSWIICLHKKKLLEGAEDPYCINCFHDQVATMLPGTTRQDCMDGWCAVSVEQICQWKEGAFVWRSSPIETDEEVAAESIAPRHDFPNGDFVDPNFYEVEKESEKGEGTDDAE